MLRRVACARVGRNVSAVCSSSPSTLAGSPSRYLAATLPLHSAHRVFSSRSDNEDKKNAVNAKQSAAAAAAASTTTTAAAATVAQVFATNEKTKPTSATSGSGDDVSTTTTVQKERLDPQQQQQQQQQPEVGEGVASPAAPAAASGIRSIGIKLSQDDELVRAFNNFSKSVNGCTQEEFLVGVKQAYASLAVVISAFVEKAQTPLTGLTESSKLITAAHEAAKLLDQEFKPETRENAPAKNAAAAVVADAESSTTATTITTANADAATAAKTSGAKAKTEDVAAAPASASVVAAAAPAAKATPHMKLQDSLVQQVVSTITSIIPISNHLAESIFKIWMLQKEKQVNLSSIASPSDYVLDSKLVIFARLDKARIYFNSDNIGAEVDVTMNNDYLRKLDPSTSHTPAVAQGKSGDASLSTSSASPATADGKNAKTKSNDDDDDLEEGMIQVLTDTNANARRNTAEEHTFVVDKKTRKLTSTSSPTVSAAALDASTEDKHAAAAAAPSTGSSGRTGPGGKGTTISRVQVTCVKASANDATAAAAAATSESTTRATAAEAEDDTADPTACSVFIKVNGNALPPIPADARACALLTVDVVVPPERYAYNFEWFYKRIIGYENEYERIAAARVFASNSPKSLGNFLDFVMRMITGKPVEFMFSKSIGRMIGIPEDVSETPPATRKLACMYMDASYKWVMADLITLAPVIETKLPKA